MSSIQPEFSPRDPIRDVIGVSKEKEKCIQDVKKARKKLKPLLNEFKKNIESKLKSSNKEFKPSTDIHIKHGKLDEVTKPFKKCCERVQQVLKQVNELRETPRKENIDLYKALRDELGDYLDELEKVKKVANSSVDDHVLVRSEFYSEIRDTIDLIRIMELTFKTAIKEIKESE